MRHRLNGLACGLVVCSFPLLAAAAEWNQFRGPNADGSAANAKVPTEWSESKNVNWKTAIPGRGWSTPVIENGVIWMTTAVEDAVTPEQLEAYREAQKAKGNPIAKQMNCAGTVHLKAVSVDAKSGSLLKTVDIFRVETPEGIHSLNSYASPSPIIANGRLYCHFGTLGTACIDTKTNEVLWRQALHIDHSVGPGSSPSLYKSVLIIPCDGTDAQFVAGLDISNGSIIWKTKRPPMTGSKGDLHKSFCSPLIVNHDGKDQAIVVGAQWVVSYDPLTGNELWKVRHGEGFSNVPLPVVGNGMVYICTGFMRAELWAIKLGGQGDVTETHVVWKHKKGVPNMPSPVLVGREIFTISDQGVATCLDAVTGEERWTKRVKGNYSASPLFANGKIYVSNREGETTVIQPGKEYQEVAVNTLSGQHLASPAIHENSLLLRTDTHLYRIGEK